MSTYLSRWTYKYTYFFCTFVFMAKSKFIKLTEQEREELLLGYKEGEKESFRRRCHSILLSHSEKKVMEIKTILEMKSTDSIRKWLRTWRKEGIEGLKDKHKPGRTPKLDINNDKHVKVVKKAAKGVVEKGEDLQGQIEKELSILISKKTLKRFLKNLSTNGNALEM